MPPHSIALIPFAKTAASPVELAYRVATGAPRQRRFDDHIVLEPDLDLNDYACRAVIDWIGIKIEINRPSQHQWLQALIEPIIDRNPWIKPLNPVEGKVASQFYIKFQEPCLRTVRKALSAIEAKHGFVVSALCDSMEVSVDFTPRNPSDLARHRMVGLLNRHFYPTTELPGPKDTQPRFVWGTGEEKTRHIVASGKILEADNFNLSTSEFDAAAACDATFYLGSKRGPVMWRIMDKIIDQQNKATGTQKILTDGEKRVRIEVTLQGDELHKLGIREARSVFNFNFASLRSKYFRFMLPTFKNSLLPFSAPSKALFPLIEERRLRKFLMTGVIGLSLMDHTRADFLKTNRPDLISYLRTKGMGAPRRVRSGAGPNGTMLSFGDLDRRVEMALRKLTEREKPMQGG